METSKNQWLPLPSCAPVLQHGMSSHAAFFQSPAAVPSTHPSPSPRTVLLLRSAMSLHIINWTSHVLVRPFFHISSSFHSFISVFSVPADNPKTWQEGYYYAEAIHIWQSQNLQEITSARDKEEPPTSCNQRNTWRDTPGSKPLEGHSVN